MSFSGKRNKKGFVEISAVFVLVCYIGLIFFAGDVAYAQKIESKKKAESVNDAFNTSSCIPKPYRCPHPQIQFYLYTRRTQDTPELLDTLSNNSLYNTHYNRKFPTKIIIHGFGGGRNLSPSTDMREAYFYIGDYNIIIVDYNSLAKEPCLNQISWAPRFCAKCISQLVRYLSLHPRGVKADDLHMVGYSVGAHIAGVVANYLEPSIDGKIGRITGLDPSIFFYQRGNTSYDVDPTDAHFVDILHTGAGILGQWGPNGHADFYINGGSSQPGCASDTLFKTVSCDHTRVTPFFIESIVTKRGFYAYPCPNLVSYLVGWCSPKNSEYVLMGEHVSHKARGTYYVKTNPQPPFSTGDPRKKRSTSFLAGIGLNT